MPIIKTNTPEPDPEEAPVKGIIKQHGGGGSHGGGPGTPKPPGPKGGGRLSQRIVILSAFCAIAVVAVVLALYFATFAPYSKHAFDADTLLIKVEKIVRIRSLTDLIEKKLEQNQVALRNAEKIKDEIMISTFRLALAQNIADWEKHTKSYAMSIAEVYDDFKVDPDAVSSLLKQYIEKSEETYKVGRINAIGDMTELLENVPEGKKPLAYFTERLLK